MNKYSTRDFEKDFPTDDACLDGKVTKHYRIKGLPFYSCEFCGNHVHPMAGTIFEDTKFDHLKLWFKALSYMAVTRCGVSSFSSIGKSC